MIKIKDRAFFIKMTFLSLLQLTSRWFSGLDAIDFYMLSSEKKRNNSWCSFDSARIWQELLESGQEILI